MDTTAAPTSGLIRAFSSVTDEMPYSDKGGYITGLAIDRHQNILAVDNQAAIVKVFDQLGVFRYAIGDKVLKKPWDVFVTTSGKIAVSDPGDADIKVFSKSGKYLIRSEKGLHLNYPHGVDYHPWTKETVVADRGFSCVYVHDPKGNVQQMLTEQEDDKYCLGSPHYICFDYMGNIYVTDNEDNSLVAYDTEKKHLFTYGHPDEDGACDNELNNPAAVVTDRFGNILVADTGNCRVHLLDRNGKFKDYILTWEDGIGEPIAMALTEDGNLIISEGNTGVIKIYSYMHLPYVIDPRVKTPEDGGDNYDIISIESGPSLKSESDTEDDENEDNKRRSLNILSDTKGKREVSHKDFDEKLLALSASDPKRTQHMPKHGVKDGKQSGMNQWDHVTRGKGSADDEINTGSAGIKGILKNSGKPRFDFFTPKNNVDAVSQPHSATSTRSHVLIPEHRDARITRNENTSAYSRKSNTLPRSASSPKQQHSAGLHTREATKAVTKQQNPPKNIMSKDRIMSADSRASLESSQSMEKPIVIIDRFKSGATMPRIDLLGKGTKGSRKTNKMADKSSVSQSVQSQGSYQNSRMHERYLDEMSSKKSLVSINSLSSIGQPREEEEMLDEVAFEHYSDDIFDKDIRGFDAHDDVI